MTDPSTSGVNPTGTRRMGVGHLYQFPTCGHSSCRGWFQYSLVTESASLHRKFGRKLIAVQVQAMRQAFHTGIAMSFELRTACRSHQASSVMPDRLAAPLSKV